MVKISYSVIQLFSYSIIFVLNSCRILFMNKYCSIRSLLVCSIFLCSFVSVWGQNDSLAAGTFSSKKAYVPEPVVPFRDTLFYVNSLGSFSSEERAESITQKIRNVSKEWSDLKADSLTVLIEGSIVDVV